jgi:hypothetical protein
MLKRFAVVMALVALVGGLFLPALASAQSAPPPSIIVKLVAGVTDPANVVATNGGILRSSIPALGLHVIDVPAAELADTLARYQADPRVERAEENKVRVSESVPGDPLYADQWALPRIAWDQVFGTVTPTGTAKVAILDTGVDALHPELAGMLVPGTSILDNSNGTTDPSGHGTWLAGIIAAQTGGTSPDGIAGVAYDGVRIMLVTVLNTNGEGLDSDVIAGVIWAVDHGADVILMAFSNPGFSSALQEAIDYAWSRGVVLVAAAGNNASSTPAFPAGDRGVMGVAATDQNDALASFSNEGQAVFIAAPGTDIQTTNIGDAYSVISGTSAAAAHVAGLAAFMKAVDPTLPNGVIVFRIASTADPAGTQAQTGNGRINMARALASTATESIQPAGTAPVGEGGPFVGPYVAANHVITTITGAPPNPSTSPIATFTWTTNVAGATSQCQLDSGGFGPCTSGQTYIGLSAGSHTFEVRSRTTADPGGQGATVSRTWTIVLDSTPPIITPTVTGTAGANGWYTSNVTVSWNFSDPESGIASSSGCGSITLSSETTGQTVTCSATNGAGLSNSASVTIKLDKTPPSATLAVTAGTLGSGGWYVSNVTVGTSGADSISSPVTCTAPQTLTSDTAGTTVNGSCTNDAGLTKDATALTVKLDTTPPTATLAVTAGTPGAHGWYTSDVTIGTTGSDSISGPVTCTADQLQTAETTGAVFNGSCTNSAGLTGDAPPLTVKLDKTPPSATLAVTAGTLGSNGWYVSDVTVGTSGTDTISSPVVCTGLQYQTTETGGAVFNGSCTNNAGLSANAPPLTVKLDRTPPTVTFNGDIQNGQSFYFGFVPAQPLCSATDNLSGVASCSIDGYGTTVGPHTLTATATDTAGNTAPATRSYTVLAWTINGFFQPVDMNGVWNTVKGGSTVPLKFEVFAGPTELTSTSIVSALVKEVTCNAGAEDTVEVVATGGTSLRYDGPAGQFIYNWQTPKLPGKCYTVTLTTLDGSSISAPFKLK